MAAARFFWTLPVAGDGREVRRDPLERPRVSEAFTDARRGRFDFYDYLLQVARAARASGFDGLFIPWDALGEDPWIVAATLARSVDRLHFVPEVQPGFSTPVYFAKLAATFRRFAGDRLAYALDLSLDPSVRRAHGERLDGPAFLARAREFAVATAGVAQTHPYDFEGEHFQVQAGGLREPLGGRPPLPLYTSGNTPEVLEFAAAHADVHLFELSGDLERELPRLREAAAANQRTLLFGIRATVVARHDDAEADDAAGDVDEASKLVGSYERVAERIQELGQLGVTQFILDGAPHLEEAYRFGERLLPLLSPKIHSRVA